MEDLLKAYIQHCNKWEVVSVIYYEVDGAICKVHYYTDVDKYYTADMNVNIWDMLLYMHINTPIFEYVDGTIEETYHIPLVDEEE